MMLPTWNLPDWMIDPLLMLWPYLSGNRLAPRGGTLHARFYRVEELMAAEHEKLDWLRGPLGDRADYLTKSYQPFLMTGPNHRVRREQIIARAATARAQLADLEEMLGRESDPERALARFLFRHFGRFEAVGDDVDKLFDYRAWGSRLLLLPKWLRTMVFRVPHERLRNWRAATLERMEAAGEPLADTFFDVIWFQSSALGFYAATALQTLRDRPDLLSVIREEIGELPSRRPRTVALIHEILRLHTRDRATYYLYNGRAEIASIARAAVDQVRYANPRQVDLDRDYSDEVAFGGPSPARNCPGSLLAPEMIACVVAYQLRAELEKGAQPSVATVHPSLQNGTAPAATCPMKGLRAEDPVTAGEPAKPPGRPVTVE